ncbi:MAG: hypothetical protein JO104_06295 [Candidatus Eremiobacteraeota bacterium]|nr:hypothetical protein [Candidatus Eremiobacteraeota bacterium]
MKVTIARLFAAGKGYWGSREYCGTRGTPQMLLPSFVRRAATAFLVAPALAACSGSLTNPSNNGPVIATTDKSGAVHGGGEMRPNRGRSWMRPSPDRCNRNGALPPCGLLYVTNYYANDVLVYSNNKLVGTLTGFNGPDGICTDLAGDVWITNNLAGNAVEYAHGGTAPVSMVSDPNVYPLGCSVDPTTGNLAIANIYATKGTQGSIAIYAGAQGPPAYYTDSSMYYVYYCGYDAAGNLFVDGRTIGGAFQFAELPKSSSTFTNITLSGATDYFPGNVQWDGSYVAVGDQQYQNANASAVYRTTGASGKVVGTTPLTGAKDVMGFYVLPKTHSLIGPDVDDNDVGLYRYPAGGNPTNRIAGFDGPSGAAISRKGAGNRLGREDPGIFPSPPPLLRALPKSRGWISPAAKRGHLVYVADGNQVLIYPEAGNNPPPVGSISDGVTSAYGLYVDRRGNLYVVNEYGPNVSVYAPGSTTPSMTYYEGLSRPLYPIVDHDGNLFVSNANYGTVVEYLRGGSTPHEVLQTAGSEADGMDFDSAGNLYVAYRNGDNGGIEEFPRGSTQGHVLGMALNQPQGVIVANDGTILAVETGNSRRVDVFPPGLMTPSFELAIPYTPTQIAITQPEQYLRVSTLSQQGYVYGIRYPIVGTNGEPHPLRERIETGSGGVQGLALSNGQYF